MSAARPPSSPAKKEEKAHALRSYPSIIPPQIQPKDLHNGRLLTDEQYRQVKKHAQDKAFKPGRYAQHHFTQFGVRYTIIVDENHDVLPVYSYESYELSQPQRALAEEILKGLNPGCYPKAKFVHPQVHIPYDIIKDEKEIVSADTRALAGKGLYGEIEIVQPPPSHPQQWAVTKTADIDEKVRPLLEGELKNCNDTGLSTQIKLFESKSTAPSKIKVEFLMAYIPGVRIQDVPKEFYRRGPQATTRMALALFTEYMAKIFNKGLLHKDVSYNNFHYDYRWNRAGVLDLGSAQRYEKDKTARYYKRVVTPPFCDPDLFYPCETSKDGVPQFVFSEKTEVYSWGVFLTEILLRRHRYRQQGGFGFSYCVLDQSSGFENDPAVAKFLRSMMHSNPKERPTLAQVHDFLRSLNHKYDPKTKKLKDDLAFLALKTNEDNVVVAISKLIDMLSGLPVDFDDQDFEVYCKNKAVADILKQNEDALSNACEGFFDEIRKRELKKQLVALHSLLPYTEDPMFKAVIKLENYADGKPVDIKEDYIAIYCNEERLFNVIKMNAPTEIANRMLAYKNKMVLKLQLQNLYDALLLIDSRDPIVLALKKLLDKLNGIDVVFTKPDMAVYHNEPVVADILKKNPILPPEYFAAPIVKAKEELDLLIAEYKLVPALHRSSPLGIYHQPIINLLQKLKDHLDKKVVVLDEQDIQMCEQNHKIKAFVAKYRDIMPMASDRQNRQEMSDQKPVKP